MSHWIDELMADHTRMERALVMIDKQLSQPESFNAATVAPLLEFLYEFGERCHNQKEEQILFPHYAKYGVPTQGGPIAVMLMEHQREREYLKHLIPETIRIKEQLEKFDGHYRAGLAEFVSLTKDHIWKENDILYPMGRRMFAPEDDDMLVTRFAAILEQMPYRGLNFIEHWETMLDAIEQASGGRVDLLKSLDTATLRAVLDTLPVELTFIDADDVVRYYNKVDDKKIFSRSLSIIGRHVQQCHPPKSVHLVNRIVTEMKAGKRDVAAFWIPYGEQREMFLYISYYAVRDAQGNYLGCVEMNQDIAPFRALQGESRTLASIEQEG